MARVKNTPADQGDVLPSWAERWLRGRCGCGGRLCFVDCYCGGHTVCARSGWSPEKCEEKS